MSTCGVYLSQSDGCNGFYEFVGYSAAQSGYYESAGASSPDCRFLWKNAPDGTWVIGSGPVDSDVSVPPMPVLRSQDAPGCAENAASFLALVTNASTDNAVYTQSMQPTSASAHHWCAAPRFNCSAAAPVLPSAAASASTVPTNTALCFGYEWGKDYSSFQAARTLDGIPANHPAVTRPCIVDEETGTQTCLKSCVPVLSAGDPIPATTKWTQRSCRKNVVGAELFYGYGFPNKSTSNTGYLSPSTMSMFFIRDTADAIYLVSTLGAPGTKSGKMIMQASSTGLAGLGLTMVKSDDPGGGKKTPEKGPEASWDDATGTGQFSWSWSGCCGDGMVLGPFPSIGFSLTLTASLWKHVDFVRPASYSPVSKDLEFFDIPVGTALGGENAATGVRIIGATCDSFCSQHASCGECTASKFCGWCGETSTCIFSETSGTCGSDWRPPLTCCEECTQQASVSSCLATPGCGFLYDRATPGDEAGHCVSGSLTQSPCDLAGSSLEDAACVAG